MKKVFSFVAVSLALVLSASFISCKAPSGGSGSGGGSSGGESGGGGQNPPAVQTRIKAPGEAKEVGDIVFNDGSAVPYTAELTLTGYQKSKAIAVIYKVDGSKAYGVGLIQSQSTLEWCLESAKGFNRVFADIRCTPSGSPGDYTFTGDTDGSDNFAKIKKALGTNDDTGNEGNYPAFEFAINYKNQTNSHVAGTVYENGWYLPSIAELFDICKEKATVDAASELCGGSKFANDGYWSSSQYESNGFFSYIVNPYGVCGNGGRTASFCVCCIHVF